MENEQAVVEETDVAQEASTEESNAQDLDLDNLLEEYSGTGETETSPPTQESTDDSSKVDKLISMFEQERADTARTAASKELNSTVKSIKGDLGVDEKFVKAFLNMKAEDDPRLQQAYINKDKNPSNWAKIERSLRNDLQKFVGGQPDEDLTDTRNAVASSVLNSKSTSQNSDDGADMSKMSDVEFEKHKKEVFKKAGRGAF